MANDYPWLRFDSALGVMYCKYCRECSSLGVYATGTKNFKNTNLKRHVSSADHRHAVVVGTSCARLDDVAAQMISTADAAVITAMRNIYWLAKEEVATLKYSSLNDLLVLQGCQSMKDINVGRTAQYSSYHIAEEMQEAISACGAFIQG